MSSPRSNAGERCVTAAVNVEATAPGATSSVAGAAVAVADEPVVVTVTENAPSEYSGADPATLYTPAPSDGACAASVMGVPLDTKLPTSIVASDSEISVASLRVRGSIGAWSIV